ncbi:MAG: ribonuclease HI family protein [Candidatus Babeliales bacterium]
MKQLNFLEQCSKTAKPVDDSATRWQLYIDGASRNNPGPSGAGVYILKNDQLFYAQGFYLGKKTNNEAEYYALLIGIFICKEAMESSDTVYIASDSQLVIKQLLGEFQVRKPEIKKLYDAARILLSDLSYSLCHILREQNSRADLLANKGIDTHNPLPHDFIAYANEHNITI